MESSKEKEANLSAIINEDEKLEIYKESKTVYEKKQAKFMRHGMGFLLKQVINIWNIIK